MKKRNKIIIGTVLGLVAILSVIFILNRNSANKSNLDQPSSAQKQEKQKIKTKLILNFGAGNIITTEKKVEKGSTVFDLLKKVTQEKGIIIETKKYDQGVLVQKIGNKKNDQNEKSWIYYVNDEMVEVASNKKKLQNEDIVLFKFQESPF